MGKLPIDRLVVTLIGIIPIILGSYKIYQHIFSPWRWGYLDYFLGIGLIIGGFLVIAGSYKMPILLVSGFLVVFEIYKMVLDRRDSYDLFLAAMAIMYLAVPYFNLYRAKKRLAKMNTAAAIQRTECSQ